MIPRWARIVGIIAIASLFLIPIDNLTRSSSFCGSCHFEKPLLRTWSNSGHALGSNFYGKNVDCVECHVAPGVSGYVEGKIRGLRHISIQFLGIPHDPRDPKDVSTEIPDANCIKCHAAAPHRLSELGESDIPLINAEWISRNAPHISKDELRSKQGLVMAHRAHMVLSAECAECHVNQRSKYPQMDNNEVLSNLQKNPMGCVACHKYVVHRPLHLDADSTKYYVTISNRNIYIDVPSEEKVCGVCHRNEHKCEWENGKTNNTFSISAANYCMNCHPNFSVF